MAQASSTKTMSDVLKKRYQDTGVPSPDPLPEVMKEVAGQVTALLGRDGWSRLFDVEDVTPERLQALDIVLGMDATYKAGPSR